MLRAVLLSAVVASSALLAARGAQAQARTPVVDPIDVPPEHDPLAHAWDDPDAPDERGGFYLRAGVGIGLQATRIGPPPWENDSYGVRARGFGTDFSLDVGGMLNEHVALHLDAHTSALWSGTIHRDFALAGENAGTARIVAFGFAPGVTFFTRRDFFLKVGVGLGIARGNWPGHHDFSRPGVYADLTVGKDVYRNDHSSVGVNMQFVYMRLGDDDREDELRVRALTWGVSYAFDSI